MGSSSLLFELYYVKFLYKNAWCSFFLTLLNHTSEHKTKGGESFSIVHVLEPKYYTAVDVRFSKGSPQILHLPILYKCVHVNSVSYLRK